MCFGICSNVGLPLAARHPEALEVLDVAKLPLLALGASALLFFFGRAARVASTVEVARLSDEPPERHSSWSARTAARFIEGPWRGSGERLAHRRATRADVAGRARDESQNDL